MKIKNSVILITGGSLGIGRAISKLLVECDANVIITGRDEHRLEVSSKETGAFSICADVSKLEDNKKTIEIIKDKYGRLDVLINNAGVGSPRKEITHLQEDEFQNVFSTNVFGAAMLTKIASTIFKRQNYGVIVNIGSTASIDGYEGGSVYVSSKFALRGLTKCWQLELSKYNVRVMLVCPGDVYSAWGSPERKERKEIGSDLRGKDIAFLVKHMIEMDDYGFIPEVIISPLSTFKDNSPLFY